MQKELLLAIGDDRAASYNLRFLKEVFDSFCDLKLTLFYVAPRLTTWEMDERSLVPRGTGYDEFREYTKTKGEKSLDDALMWIRDIAGCSGANVSTKVVHSRKGTVRELIDEARKGMYDAMLLGRKGFTWFEEVFENSVTHELLWQDIDFPIWICKQSPASPRHDVLLCVDGSAPALRMVDHAAYMLAEEPRHTFTLFHVARSGYEIARSGRVFDEALAMLADHSISEERIELKMVTSKSVSRAVLKEAVDGRYSAVGVGNHGTGAPNRLREMFPSSLSVKLLRQLTDTALWLTR